MSERPTNNPTNTSPDDGRPLVLRLDDAFRAARQVNGKTTPGQRLPEPPEEPVFKRKVLCDGDAVRLLVVATRALEDAADATIEGAKMGQIPWKLEILEDYFTQLETALAYAKKSIRKALGGEAEPPKT